MKESGEMYLETILVVGKKKEYVRAIDVVEEMGYSKPSVSRAMSKLKADGDIEVDVNGHIKLTKKGYEIASKIFERHQVISEMLIRLGVSEKVAREDACKMEHDISDETFEVIKRHSRFGE